MSPVRLLLGVCVLLSAPLSAAEFTVSPHGDDSAIGSSAAPLATVQRARELARQALARGERQIQVTLRAGVHALDRPLRLEPEDAPPGTVVRWQGEPGAVLSGGLALSGWRASSGGFFVCDLPTALAAAPGLPAIMRGTELVPPSRWPDGPPAVLGNPVAGAPTIVPRPPLGAGELVSLFAWGVCRAPVSIDTAVRLPAGLPWANSAGKALGAGRAVYLEGLARPTAGHWRLLRADGAAQIELAADARPLDGELRVALLPEVLVVEGRPERPVVGLTISGLTISHAAWPRPAAGIEGIQAGHVAVAPGEQGVAALPAAVRIAWADGVVLSGLEVSGNAASGIAVGAGCRRVRIERSTVQQDGGCGIVVGWRGEGLASASAEWADPLAAPRDTVISRCLVAHCALADWGSVGIADLFSGGTVITGNRIEDLPYSGISLGMRWDTSGTSQRKARVEGNRIRRVMTTLLDGGAIYTLGWQPGAVITGNLIEDCGAAGLTEGAPAGGLFFDEGSKGIAVSGNVIARIHGEPLRFNGCAQSWLILGENTVVAAGATAPVPPAVAEGVGP